MTETFLTLDIGVTTGWAVFRDRALFDYSQTIDIGTTLPLLLSTYNPDIVIAERPLIYRGKLGDTLQKIVAIVQYFLEGGKRTIIYIDPAMWKDSLARRITCPKGTSQHEKDAIRIGHWYMKYQ